MTAIEHGAINTEEILELCERSFIESAEHHEDLDSTNTRALALISDIAPPSGAHLIYTEQQLAGRGRQGNHWFSAPGSLTFSLIINRTSLDLPAEKVPLMGLAAGVAVLEAGKHFLPQGEFGLKWPNDVFLNGRKVAGILMEAPAKTDCVVLGIGVNVNNKFKNGEAQLAKRGIALSAVTTEPLDRLSFLDYLLIQLGLQLGQLAGSETLHDTWNQHCLLSDRTVTIRAGKGELHGRCRGIDSEGRLLLEQEDGVEALATGEVIAWD